MSVLHILPQALPPHGAHAVELDAADIGDNASALALSPRSHRLEALGQMTSSIAHDFNNLLTIIIGATETLCETLDGQPDDQDLALVSLRAAEEGAAQIRRLLAFARRAPLDPQVVDSGQTAINVKQLASRLLPEGVAFSVRAPASAVFCRADRAELEAVLLNLCINARDAMPGGGALSLKVDTQRLTADLAEALDLAPGPYVRFTVRDDGVGMSAATLRRAVEPFFTTKSGHGGTGLGLSSAHSFAQRSGGRLTINSRPGHGATVQLYLPCISDADANRRSA